MQVSGSKWSRSIYLYYTLNKANSVIKPACIHLEMVKEIKTNLSLCWLVHICVCVYDVNCEQRLERQAGLH